MLGIPAWTLRGQFQDGVLSCEARLKMMFTGLGPHTSDVLEVRNSGPGEIKDRGAPNDERSQVQADPIPAQNWPLSHGGKMETRRPPSSGSGAFRFRPEVTTVDMTAANGPPF